MSKRVERGLYRRRGSPYWWMTYSDKNGCIHRRSTGTTSKKLAREILSKKRTLVAEGKHLDVKRIPNTKFHELCDQYWNLWGKHKRMKGLSHMMAFWKEQLGNVPIKRLSQHAIEKLLGHLLETRGVSAATRNRHLTMLKAMFNKGKEWRLIVENPAAGISRLRENGARTRFLDQEEIQGLLDAASKGFRFVLVTALHTGMRRGEIFNLRWEDVDFKNRIITIQESKSGKKRMIPMDQTLVQTLSQLSSRFKKGYVFLSERNPDKPWRDLRKPFAKAVEKAGIQDLRFHDLRHTFASQLVMAGVDIKTVQELLGHSTLTMTMRYSHLAPDHRLRAINTLDRILNFTITSQSGDLETDPSLQVAVK